MHTEVCKDCGYYRRHYVLDEQGCWAINCGHCTHSRSKSRKPHTAACGNFVRREQPSPPEKHFLTMEILRWLQGLELYPDVLLDE